jgi:hypothetical protein
MVIWGGEEFFSPCTVTRTLTGTPIFKELSRAHKDVARIEAAKTTPYRSIRNILPAH